MAPIPQALSIEKDSSLVQSTELPTQRQSEASNDTIAVNTNNIIPEKESSQSDTVESDTVVIPSAHSVYTSREKTLLVISAAFSGLFASWTAQIYLPALNNAAHDLHTSTKKINLTVTSYMIFQGVTPIFIGGYADAMGRRPVYIICFILYIAVDVALALTNSYGSLLALRSVQSITISSTQALCQGVVADISTSSERGQYAAFLALPTILGPSIGPVIGGAIAQFLGWRNIFWFLAITGGINLAVLIALFPETCRRIVGNGSILPKKSNQTLLQLFLNRRKDPSNELEIGTAPAPLPVPDAEIPKANFAWARFLSALTLLFEKELFVLSTYGGLLFAGLYAVGTAAPSLFATYYGYNGLTIGLLYLPLAAGSVAAVVLVGKMLNWNFQRHAKRLNITVVRGQHMDLSEFPIELARVEVLIPPFILSVIVITAWGWTVENRVSVGVVVVLVFLLGLGLSGVASVFSALITDIRPEKASAASASNNIIKFLLGAAMSAAIEPLISAVDPGKAFSIIASFYVVVSPCLVVVVKKGMKWRREVREKDRRASETQ
ncbi:major facilitator superfamily domain-containing protein [Xylaria sp. FL0933]|nr:major facilitator superfamily domain-containing protein [Xylaria sp. FL0933]